MTLSMTSQGNLNVILLYSFVNRKRTFFLITEKRTKISSSLVYICITGLWVCLYIHLYGSYQLWRHRIPKQVRISNCNNSVNIFNITSIKSSKYRKYAWLACLYIQLSVSLPTKKFVATLEWWSFCKCQNIKQSFNLTADMKKLCKKNYFCDVVINDVTGWPQSRPSINKKGHFSWSLKNEKYISSLHLLYICIMWLWICVYKLVGL